MYNQAGKPMILEGQDIRVNQIGSILIWCFHLDQNWNKNKIRHISKLTLALKRGLGGKKRSNKCEGHYLAKLLLEQN